MSKTLGEVLKRAREKKRLTLDDVYKKIKVNPVYIKAMEANDYGVFAGKVHSKGFLKIYAEHLDLNIDEVLALWRREHEKDFEETEQKQLRPKKFIEYPVFSITPSLVLAVSIVAMLALFFGYLFFQYRNFTGAPDLVINYPPNNLVTDSDILDITGKTDLDSEVFINNENIILNPDGSFVESVRLREGLNTISIKAVNKLSKQTEFIKTIIYRPQRQDPVIPAETVNETTPSENENIDQNEGTVTEDVTGEDLNPNSDSE